MSVKEYVLSALQEKYSIDDTVNLDTLNYIEEGYVDSFGIFQFVSDLEEEFSIEFSDEEIMSEDFRVVGKLISIVENKLQQK